MRQGRIAPSGLVLTVALMTGACQSSPSITAAPTAAEPPGTAATAGNGVPPVVAPPGHPVQVGVGNEPPGWGVLGVEGQARHEVIGFQDRRFEADPGTVFLIVTVSLEKLRRGGQPVPTSGVVLRGGGRTHRPDGFGEDDRYCLDCRLRHRTTSHVARIGFVFQVRGPEAQKRHVLLFGATQP